MVEFKRLVEAERARFQQSRKMIEALNDISLFFEYLKEDEQMDIIVKITQGDHASLKKIARRNR